jgi:hypothetical protein
MHKMIKIGTLLCFLASVLASAGDFLVIKENFHNYGLKFFFHVVIISVILRMLAMIRVDHFINAQKWEISSEKKGAFCAPGNRYGYNMKFRVVLNF